MMSSFTPPVLYLSDDDDDNESEQNIPYTSSFTSVLNDHLPRKKRKLTNTNVRINPSIVNWSKRQRNDHYQHQQPLYNSHYHESEPIINYSDEYNLNDQESHSFLAFDWTSQPRTPTRIYSNPFQTTSHVSTAPSPTVMNIVRHHLDPSDTGPSLPSPYHNDRYIQHSQRKSTNIPISITPPPPLVLPLPTPTSSLIRLHKQRTQTGKNIRIPYSHSISPPPPPPPPPLPIHHQVNTVFPPTTYRPPSPGSISTLISTPEIRRQALHGTGILSAFYDSQCYRCNICKFKSVTSSILLQHLFTHIFFCDQCPFYSYSHHHLYQHIFEKHKFNFNHNNTDPTNLELLYITRCSDGTFALCMDSSPPIPTTIATQTDDKIIEAPEKTKKPRRPRRKAPKAKNDQVEDIVLLAEKRDIPPQPVVPPGKHKIPPQPVVPPEKHKIPPQPVVPPEKPEIPPPPVVLPEKQDIPPQPSTSSSLTIPKRPLLKKKPMNIYVLMKHRRCYSIRYPLCLHSLTLEYNICREHTIRQMCHTQRILKRRKFKPKSNRIKLIDQVALCLKTVVNHLVNIEDNRDSHDLVCPLPNNILNLLFPSTDLHTITNLLRLNNKYTKSLEQNEQNHSELAVRTSNQHIFILSSSGVNKNEQSIFNSLHTSITNVDSTFTHTKLNKLPISYENTHRFLKGNLNILQRPINSTDDTIPRSTPAKNGELNPPTALKSSRYANPPSTSPTIDTNNNTITSSKSQFSPTPTVIVLD